MFLFIRELPKSRKKSFFSLLICSPSSILKAIFVKFSISEDKIFGILDFSNKPFTSLILLSSLDDFEEYKFDYSYAEENIRYFDLINVPRLKEKPMAGVKKIKFQSDLTGIKSVNQFDEDSFYSNLFLEVN